MAKRINGEGNVRKHPKRELYEGRYSFVDATGKRKVGSVYGKTSSEALEKLRDAQARIAADKPAKDSRQTVAAWVNEWADGKLVISDRKATTKELYQGLARNHIIPPPFGDLELAKLRPSHIQVLLHHLQEKGLASSSIRSIYATLNGALEDARLDNRIAANPMRDVKRPSTEQAESKHLAAADVRLVLSAAEGLRYKPVLELLAVTGMRRGEALALEWSDIDLDKGAVRVRQTLSRSYRKLQTTTTKTAKSRREVPISSAMIATLKEHRQEQRLERLKAGPLWHDGNIVFATELGGYADPRNVLRSINTAAQRAGLKGIGLHTLRHSAATAMLEANVPIHVVSRILGHSSITTTIDLYGHVNDSSKREALDGLSEAMGL